MLKSLFDAYGGLSPLAGLSVARTVAVPISVRTNWVVRAITAPAKMELHDGLEQESPVFLFQPKIVRASRAPVLQIEHERVYHIAPQQHFFREQFLRRRRAGLKIRDRDLMTPPPLDRLDHLPRQSHLLARRVAGKQLRDDRLVALQEVNREIDQLRAPSAFIAEGEAPKL